MKWIIPIAAILILFSCKEKEEVDPCTNGFVDSGENGVDCGGNCPPCEPNYAASLSMSINLHNINFWGTTITYDGSDYILNVTNDSVAMTLNLGTDGTVGNFNVLQQGSLCTYHGIDYPLITTGTSAVSANDLQNHLLSGFFQVNFYRSGFTDTVKITNGQFDYVPY